eukprot:CAMPEP_0168539408 /NCGR_PEP_ID=MMETSP0405-20121227/21810_1 /TAXON_ID=498012 /ORGANISM="Trichosphaerium sp, Strain Am-I-7 wt" /LENGTH=132 /DNA_ID=CAMNT_0008568965 /DNA_START=509 /DNA_END=904 /DNA_ORIENTATION=-
MSVLAHYAQNFHAIRDYMDNVIPLPAVPYIGIYLKDLTALNANTTDYVEDETNSGETQRRGKPAIGNSRRLVNFQKCNEIAKIVEDATKFQAVRFPFEEQDWIVQQLLAIGGMDSDQMYEVIKGYNERKKRT